MGRERAVLCWDIHHTLLHDAIARTEGQLAAQQPVSSAPEQEAQAHAQALNDELASLRRQLRALGPSPRAKMG
jgi:hypothetical protein